MLVAGRGAFKAEQVAEGIRAQGRSASAFTIDATREEDVARLFDVAMTDDEYSALADLIVYNAGDNVKLDFRETEFGVFEAFGRVNTLGGFIVGREAARRFVPLGRGTVLFTGATGSLRGMPGFAHFATSKAGLRMIGQSIAREYGKLGLHVTHFIIDGGIDGERVRTLFRGIEERFGNNGMLDIDAIAENYWHLHNQHPSAWTQERHLRPFKENF